MKHKHISKPKQPNLAIKEALEKSLKDKADYKSQNVYKGMQPLLNYDKLIKKD